MVGVRGVQKERERGTPLERSRESMWFRKRKRDEKPEEIETEKKTRETPYNIRIVWDIQWKNCKVVGKTKGKFGTSKISCNLYKRVILYT